MATRKKERLPLKWRVTLHHNVEHRDIGTADECVFEEAAAWTPGARVAIERAWGSSDGPPVFSVRIDMEGSSAEIDLADKSSPVESSTVEEQIEDLLLALEHALAEARRRALFSPGRMVLTPTTK